MIHSWWLTPVFSVLILQLLLKQMGMLQVRVAAEDYHAEFAQKEATIASLTSDAEAQRAQMQQKIDRLASDMEVSTAACISRAMTLHSLMQTWSCCCNGSNAVSRVCARPGAKIS